jgi:hypothetical protein
MSPGFLVGNSAGRRTYRGLLQAIVIDLLLA